MSGPGEDVAVRRPLLPDVAANFYDPVTLAPGTDLTEVEGRFGLDPHVASTDMRWSRRRSAWVSTVFLRIDHNFGEGAPVLWETMIFSSHLEGIAEELDLASLRYDSQAESIHGHGLVVTVLMKILTGQGFTPVRHDRPCPLLELQAAHRAQLGELT